MTVPVKSVVVAEERDTAGGMFTSVRNKGGSQPGGPTDISSGDK